MFVKNARTRISLLHKFHQIATSACFFEVLRNRPINGQAQSDLALGFIECINKMGGPLNVIMFDGKGDINNSGLFQKYFEEHHITYIPTRGHPVCCRKGRLGVSQRC